MYPATKNPTDDGVSITPVFNYTYIEILSGHIVQMNIKGYTSKSPRMQEMRTTFIQNAALLFTVQLIKLFIIYRIAVSFIMLKYNVLIFVSG